jgi:hypothetical protein
VNFPYSKAADHYVCPHRWARRSDCEATRSTPSLHFFASLLRLPCYDTPSFDPTPPLAAASRVTPSSSETRSAGFLPASRARLAPGNETETPRDLHLPHPRRRAMNAGSSLDVVGSATHHLRIERSQAGLLCYWRPKSPFPIVVVRLWLHHDSCKFLLLRHILPSFQNHSANARDVLGVRRLASCMKQVRIIAWRGVKRRRLIFTKGVLMSNNLSQQDRQTGDGRSTKPISVFGHRQRSILLLQRILRRRGP